MRDGGARGERNQTASKAIWRMPPETITQKTQANIVVQPDIFIFHNGLSPRTIVFSNRKLNQEFLEQKPFINSEGEREKRERERERKQQRERAGRGMKISSPHTPTVLEHVSPPKGHAQLNLAIHYLRTGAERSHFGYRMS